MTILQTQAPPLATGRAERRFDRDMVVVTLLTVIAIAFRLATAGQPALWSDEANTFRRVSGTFAELTQMLHQDAFVPLHYYLYWLLGRALGGAEHLTPFWMRFIPAVSGGLMVPVMWLLARQLTERSTSLLVAAFTACSSFLFVYSHDAKMYMPLWLLAASNALCFLMWSRDARLRFWAAWVVTGSAMCMYHATGWIVIGAGLFYFIVSRRGGWLLYSAGLAIITTGPIAYYATCAELISMTRSVGWHAASGIAWVDGLVQQRTPLDRWIILASTYLLGCDWPQHGGGTLTVVFISATVSILAVVVLGIVCALRRYWTARVAQTDTRATAAFLAFWLFAPLVVAHELSKDGPTSASIAAGGACVMVASILTAKLLWPMCISFLHRRGSGPLVINTLNGLLLPVAVVAVLGVIANFLRREHSTGVWIARYLGVAWIPLVIVVCASLMQIRPVSARSGAIVLLLLVNTAQCLALVTVSSEPPVDRIAADVVNAARSGGPFETFVPADAPSSQGTGGGDITGTVGRYYLAFLTRNKLGPRGFSESALEDYCTIHLYTDPGEVRAALNKPPQPRRVVVWQWATNRSSAPALNLGPSWYVVSDQWIPVRSHWSWRTLFEYHRIEFSKTTP